VWEQSLAERLKGTPVDIEARMEGESILYTTVTLFASMAVVVLALFAGIIWMVIRKGRKQQDAT
jgi:nitrate reductase NapE component